MKIKNIEINLIPDKAGVYLISNKNKILYIGKSINLRQRINDYFSGADKRFQIPSLLSNATDINFIATNSEQEAIILEYNLIRKNKPVFNIQTRDAPKLKYLSINMSDDIPLPQIIDITGTVFNKDMVNIGPIPPKSGCINGIKELCNHLKITQCSSAMHKMHSKNMLKQLGCCTGVCDGSYPIKKHIQSIKRLIKILSGNDKNILNELEKKRLKNIQKLEFEKAELLHKTQQFIESMSIISTRNNKFTKPAIVIYLNQINNNITVIHFISFCTPTSIVNYTYNKDVVEDISEIVTQIILHLYLNESMPPLEIILNIKMPSETIKIISDIIFNKTHKKIFIGTNKEDYQKLCLKIASVYNQISDDYDTSYDVIEKSIIAKELDIANLKIIHCIDISHMGSKACCGCIVEFIDSFDQPKKIYYYNVSDKNSNSDTGSMSEVTHMHINNLMKKNIDLPDLIIVDGGKGQVKSVNESIKKMLLKKNINVISIAKDKGDHSKKLTNEKIYKPDLSVYIPDKKSKLLFMIQNIRDCAHFYAKKHMLRKMWTNTKSSLFTKIKGIGTAYNSKLLSIYNTASDLMKDSPEEISNKTKIPLSLSKTIKKEITKLNKC